MALLLRQRALSYLFGGGVTGAVASSGLNWVVDQVREAVSHEPQRIDVARLRVGETYLVTTRPPMSRAERRVDARVRKIEGELRAARHPDRRTRRVALRLAAAQRTQERARPGSRRHATATARAEVLGPRFDRLTRPTPRELRRAAELDTLRSRQAELRAAAMHQARAPRRRPVERRFL